MSVRFKPEGYSSVSPYLVVEDARSVVDFLEKTFDATELRRYEFPDGSIMHVELRIDDTVVMIGEGGDDFDSFSSNVHVYVDDVDATYRRALNAGGVSIETPRRKEGDPDRRGSVNDPAGNVWSIATQVE